MAWERRSGTASTYYYEARRMGSKVVKTCLGSGPAARMAAKRVADGQVKQSQAARLTLELRERTHPAEALLDRQYEVVMTLATAALYAAGLWRPCRHDWRMWREGIRELRAAG